MLGRLPSLGDYLCRVLVYIVPRIAYYGSECLSRTLTWARDLEIDASAIGHLPSRWICRLNRVNGLPHGSEISSSRDLLVMTVPRS